MEIFNVYLKSEVMIYVALAFIVLLLFVSFILIVSRSQRRSKAKAVAPQFSFENLQLAPLGKGIHLKVKNGGASAIITDVILTGRNDIELTQAYKDYKVDQNQSYSIYCETIAKGRADKGYEITISFQDQLGNLYQQGFTIDYPQAHSSQARLLKYA